jgi:hypothetical protein
VTSTFGGGWEGALALPWPELLLRYVEASVVYDETWGLMARILARTR